MHEKELFKICVGSLISWCKLFCEVTVSIFLSSLLVISLFYQLLDLALNSPRATIKKWLFWARVSKSNYIKQYKIIIWLVRWPIKENETT